MANPISRRRGSVGMVTVAMGFQLLATALAAVPIALPGCPESCGDVVVPFPFGIGQGCFHEGFNLTCDGTHRPPKLLMGEGDGVQVLGISLPDGTVHIRSSVLQLSSDGFNGSWSVPSSSTGIFKVSAARNSFVAFGCNMAAHLIPQRAHDELDYASICAAMCTDSIWYGYIRLSSCSGVACCRTSIAFGLPSYDIQIKQLTEQGTVLRPYGTAAFIVDQDWFIRNEGEMAGNLSNDTELDWSRDLSNLTIPAVLEWSLDLIRDEGLFSLAPTGPGSSDFRCPSSNSLSYSTDGNYDRRRCNCSKGYEGNPYINDGCQDIDECQQPDVYLCHGTCVNLPGSYRCSSKKNIRNLPGIVKISEKLKRQRTMKLRQKFFKRNHGLLLQQLISSNKDIAERLRIFSLEELEEATNKFDQNRILGGGGHGTVYKGILSDQHVVAIKKSKIVVQREIDQFINEVVILSQINHRNIVKLFGCCLETEVPLLVYEFISNGTLTYHLHEQIDHLSWKDRLRIALEIARAIAYLHSAASISVFHRDIKCANILLTDALTAKVSDFGASRSISIDETGILTAIQGTHGYLDPEYYYTSRLTEKSDVYSFGVILAELLTRIKPVFFPSHSSESTSLASYFVSQIRENLLPDILDQQIVEEAGAEDAEVVAKLAEACLGLRGEERPTMRQVETKLEDLQGSKVNSQINRTGRNSWNVQASAGSKGGEATRLYSLEKEFIQSSEFPR